MRSDEELERLLEDWLEDEAQPIPRDVLEGTLESVARTPQTGPRGGTGWLWGGPMGILSAAAVLLLLAVAGGLTVDRIGSFFPGDSPSPRPEQVWDLAVDVHAAPNQNPGPDSHGNPGVWSYLSSFIAHDPSAYVLLPVFEPLAGTARGKWTDPAVSNLHIYEDPSGLVLHPWKGPGTERFVIVGWTSPIEGDVTVRGSFRMADGSCTRLGSGISFFVDRESQPLFASQIESGGIDDFDVAAAVRVGESIYFLVDPGTDSSCDSTLLTLVISTAQPVASP